MARRLHIHPQNPQQRLIDQAAQSLRAGGLWLVPGDSGYAFVFTLDARAAAERVSRIRALGPRHDFTLLCADIRQIGQYTRLDDAAFRFVRSHGNGDYTYVLPASTLVPKRIATEKRRSIGVRLPRHLVTRRLLEAVGEPLLSSSAKLPGHEEYCLDHEELWALLEARIDGFLDVGACPEDPSTVVSLLETPYELIRAGRGEVDWR